MPKSVPPEFNTEKNKLKNRPVHLFTLYAYDGSTNLYLNDSPADVTFNGQTYSRFPITFDVIGENNAGQIDQINVTLGNVSRLIQGYLEQYDLRRKKVSIKTVWLDQLGDTDNLIDDIYYIDSYTADQDNVGLVLTSKFDVLDISLPLRHYSRNYCQWKFKGTECGYAGADSTCKKTKADCKARAGGSNFARFGGFPSIQPNRVVLG